MQLLAVLGSILFAGTLYAIGLPWAGYIIAFLFGLHSGYRMKHGSDVY